MLQLSHGASKPGKYHGMLSPTEAEIELKIWRKPTKDTGKLVCEKRLLEVNVTL
jgi:hypothetical protein